MTFDKESPYYQGSDKKPIQPMTFDVPTKSTEDKIYIVIMEDESNDPMFDGQYKICHGRTECYRYIQGLIEAFGEDVPVHTSKVITETKQTETDTGNSKYYLINYDESLSIYAFCKAIEMYYTDDKFSIDDHFSAPMNNDNYRQPISEKEAFAYAANIEDPIIAQAAIETFKERSESLLKQAMAFPNAVEKITEDDNRKPYVSNKELFPDLFEQEDDGSINV